VERREVQGDVGGEFGGEPPLKERVVDRRFDPLTWLGSKIGRRPKD